MINIKIVELPFHSACALLVHRVTIENGEN